MSFKIIFIIGVSVFITLLFMQNSDAVNFEILFISVNVSKTFMLALVLVIGFILGLTIAGKKANRQIEEKKSYPNIPLEIENSYNEDQEYISMNPKKGLSNEDRDYIN
jgi:uncharacterized membrane protein YciS (DUF1049 family)